MTIAARHATAGRAVGAIAPDAAMTRQWLDMGIPSTALSSGQARIGYAGRQFMKEEGRRPWAGHRPAGLASFHSTVDLK